MKYKTHAVRSAELYAALTNAQSVEPTEGDAATEPESVDVIDVALALHEGDLSEDEAVETLLDNGAADDTDEAQTLLAEHLPTENDHSNDDLSE